MKMDCEYAKLLDARIAALAGKKEALNRYRDALEQANRAYDAMQSAWDICDQARAQMNWEHEKRQAALEPYSALWDSYRSVLDANNARIKALRQEAERTHRAMTDCFRHAEEDNEGSHSIWHMAGRVHMARRNAINEEIQSLIQGIKAAKAYAQALTPHIDSSAYERAKLEFIRAKEHHNNVKEEFNRLAKERDTLKKALDQRKAEFIRIDKAFDRKLSELIARQSAADRRRNCSEAEGSTANGED